MRSGHPRVVAWIALLAICSGCATTHLPPISSAGEAFEPLKDERRLWERSRDEERTLRENVTLYNDPLLEDYLDEIVGRLNPPGMADNRQIDYRVTVVEDPTLNAFAYPHGSLFVHTGLLARMHNEDQIATVLGHEMTHVEYRHMLRYQRSARNKQIGLGIAAVAAAVVIAGEQGEAWEKGNYSRAARIGVLADVFVGLGLTLAVLAAVNGYGRDLEREADLGGFDKLTRAGYDPAEAPHVYEALLEDHGDSGDVEAFFFGSHPQLANRIEGAEAWLAEHPADSAAMPQAGDPERFARRIRPVIRDDALLNIELGRLELAGDQLDRALELDSRDARVHAALGLLHAARAEREKDPVIRAEAERAAADAYREAIRLEPDLPAPHRALGLHAYRTDDFETACVQFRHYVELAPDAADAERIREYVRELERDGSCPR